MKIPVTELDIVFISYDEPDADANFADLQSKCPESCLEQMCFQTSPKSRLPSLGH